MLRKLTAWIEDVGLYYIPAISITLFGSAILAVLLAQAFARHYGI